MLENAKAPAAVVILYLILGGCSATPSSEANLRHSGVVPHELVEKIETTGLAKIVPSAGELNVSFHPAAKANVAALGELFFLRDGNALYGVGGDYFHIDANHVYASSVGPDYAFLRVSGTTGGDSLLMQPQMTANLSALLREQFQDTASIYLIAAQKQNFVFHTDAYDGDKFVPGSYYLYLSDGTLAKLVFPKADSPEFDLLHSFDYRDFFSSLRESLRSIGKYDSTITLGFDDKIMKGQLKDGLCVLDRIYPLSSTMDVAVFDEDYVFVDKYVAYHVEVTYQEKRITELGSPVVKEDPTLVYETEGRYFVTSTQDFKPIPLDSFAPEARYYATDDGYILRDGDLVTIRYGEKARSLRIEGELFLYVRGRNAFLGDHSNLVCLDLDTLKVAFSFKMNEFTRNGYNSLEAYPFGDDFVIYGDYIDLGK